MNVIEMKDVSVVYQGHHFYQPSSTILNRVSLQVKKGEVFGLVGPNGAGKTTLIKALLGFVFPNEGKIKIFGELMPHAQVYGRLGYLAEQPVFYPHLSADELLTYDAGFLHLPKRKIRKSIEGVIERVGLGDIYKHKKLGEYSKGMLQRFGLAQALLNDPPLLILDEPMSGLDPMGRHDLTKLIQSLHSEGKTILLASHILNDVETLSDRISILHQGQLIKTAEIEELLSSTIEGIQVVLKAQPELEGKICKFFSPCAQIGHRLVVVVKDYMQLKQLIDIVQKAKGSVISIEILRDSLEAYFLKTFKSEAEHE